MTATDAVLVVALLAAVLAVGSVHVQALLAVAPFALASGVLPLWRGELPAGRAPWVSWICSALCVYTLVQALPLPMSVLTALAPGSADVWSRALLPFGEPVLATGSISMDPGASIAEALRWACYGAVFLGAGSFAARHGRTGGALLVLGAGGVVAAAVIGHGLAGATRVFGIYTPRFGGVGWQVGPLINPNNLAGYMNLAALAGVGLMAARRPVMPRWVLGLAVASVLAAGIRPGSRGGLLSLGVALVVAVVLVGVARRDGRRTASGERLRLVLVVGLSLAVAAALLALAEGGRATRLGVDTRVDKLKIAVWALPLVKDHWAFGIGRGAFESVFPAYRTGTDNLVYTHPENLVVQWAAEWGTPVCALTMGALAWACRPRGWRLRGSPATAGLVAGVFAVVLQNFADLSLEVPGVVFAVVASLGVVWGGPSGHRGRTASQAGNPRAAVALAVVGTTCWALTMGAGQRTLTVDRDELGAGFPRDPRDPAARAAYQADLRAAVLRHPAEPFFPRQGALLALFGGEGEPLPWLQRALERGRTSGRSNYLVAVYLASRGFPEQALMQLKLAVSQDPNLTTRAALLASRVARSDADVFRAAPEGAAGLGMLRALSSIYRGERPAFAVELLEEACRREPSNREAHQGLAAHYLAALEKGDASAACSGEGRAGCLEKAAGHVRELEVLDRTAPDAVILGARLLRVEGKAAEALALLAERCPQVHPRDKCLQAWLSAATAAGEREEASRARLALEREGCTEPSRCAATLSAIGEAIVRTDPAAALTYFLRGAREEGTRARWLRAADVAKSLGDSAEVVRSLERASQLGLPDPALQRRIDQERLRALSRPGP